MNQGRRPLTAIPQRLVSNRCAVWQRRSPENREPTDSRVELSRAALLPSQRSSVPTTPHCAPAVSLPHHLNTGGPLTGNLVPRM